MQSLSSFRKLDSVKSYGIEIECVHDQMIERYQYYGFFYATNDGSLDYGRYNWATEFVSQPLPAEWLCKEITRLEKRVGAWHSNSSCGIHVHVNKKWCTEAKAKAIRAFVNALSHEDCCRLFGRVPNHYCEQSTRSRYCMINLTNKATIEFRMFSGGNAKWARYCVRMVDYMVKNAYHLNIDAIYAASDMYKAQEGA